MKSETVTTCYILFEGKTKYLMNDSKSSTVRVLSRIGFKCEAKKTKFPGVSAEKRRLKEKYKAQQEE